MVDFETQPKTDKLRGVTRRVAVAALATAALAAPSPARATGRDVKTVAHIERITGRAEAAQKKNRDFNERNQELAKKVMVGVATTMVEQYRKTQKADPIEGVEQDLYLLRDLNESGTRIEISYDHPLPKGSGRVSVIMRREYGKLVPATASSLVVSTAKKDGSLVNYFTLSNTPREGFVFDGGYAEDPNSDPVFISTAADYNGEPPTSTVLHSALNKTSQLVNRVFNDKKVTPIYAPRDVPPELSGAVVFP
jgi:hypothetical protein